MLRRIFAYCHVLAIASSFAMFSSPAAAEPPESVTGLEFGGPLTLAWDASEGAVGYHVYQGEIAGLPGSYGSCRVGSVTGTSAMVPDEPRPGAALTYLVSAFNESGEGGLGESSSSEPRTPDPACVPSRRVFPIASNGPAPDGVEDGHLARRNARVIVRGWDPLDKKVLAKVVAATGELLVSVADLEVRGRGLDWAFERTYRSQVDWSGPLGRGWFFADGEHLRRGDGGDVIHCDGLGRCETFTNHATGYDSPDGQFAELHATSDGALALRDPHGLIRRFDGFHGTATDGALRSVEDRMGNTLRYLYDQQGLLTEVVDTLGRTMRYEYDGQGRIVVLGDFSGREVVFGYDGDGNLVSVRSPAVTGTPTGNDFPDGKTTTYGYSSGFSDETLNHNLLTVTDPAGQTWLSNTYSSTPDDPDGALTYDRVVQQDVGGSGSSGVPAGGVVTFSYEALNPGADPGPGIADLERRRLTLTDPNGNVSQHDLNELGHELTHVVQTRGLRPDDPSSFVTERRYDVHGLLRQVDFAGGGSVVLTYDDGTLDRYRRGNLMEFRVVADSARGDGHGADLPDLVTTYDYEPLYNQVRSRTGPRGNDAGYVPQNGGDWSAERYTTSWSYDYQEGDPDANGVNAYASQWGISLGDVELDIGDLNGDGRVDLAHGLQVRRDDPTVRLDPGGNQAAREGDDMQEVSTTWAHNEKGQVVRVVDPTGVETTYGYHPETDPDGDGNPTETPPDGRALDPSTGGYQASAVDAAGGRTEFLYDSRGNRTDVVTPRGVRHVWIYNALDQVVEARRAAATSDAAGPSGDPPTGYGESGLEPFAYRTLFLYDENDNLVERREEDRGDTRGLGGWLTTTYEYDSLDRPVRVHRKPDTATTLTTEYRYDANGNTTREVAPGGNETHAKHDERDLLFELTEGAAGPFGGSPATTVHDYDGYGNLTRVTDALGRITAYEYDGVHRLVRQIDEVGGVTELFYDPADNVVRTASRGTVGGPSPTDRGGSGNVLLGDARYAYDELGRVIRKDMVLGMPQGASNARPADLREGSLNPRDGMIGRVLEYDAASRPTFVTTDHGSTFERIYDIRGWLDSLTTADGSEVIHTFDAGGNLVETEARDLDAVTGTPEVYLTTRFYDALDRRTMVVDNEGRAHRFIWDSRSDLETITDPNGPPGGTIARRSPGHTGEEVPVNDHGNVTEYTYDGISRMVSTRSILTASGQGDGTTSPAPDTSLPYNLSGEVRTEYGYDASSRLTRVEDGGGHVITYTYDNLDRRTGETYPDDTTRAYAYDALGNLVQLTDPAGSVFDLVYDNAHRPIQLDISPAPGMEGTTQQTCQYDGLDRLTRATDNNDPLDPDDDSELLLHYDLLGRLVEEQQRVPGLPGLEAVDRAYLAESLVARLIYPGGREVDYAYDSAGRLSQVIDAETSGGDIELEYVGMRRVSLRQAGAGLETRITFDEAARTEAIRHEFGGRLLAGEEYSYEPDSRLRTTLRTHDASGDLTPGLQLDHDSAGRVISAVDGQFTPDLKPSGPPEDEVVSLLDSEGNEPEIKWNGVKYTATPNNLERYDEPQCCMTSNDDGIPDDFLDSGATPDPDGRNFAHDVAGNQTRTGVLELRYDALGRPVRVIREDGGALVARYRYDALHRLVRRDVYPATGPEEHLVYFHSATRSIETRNDAGTLQRQVAITPGGSPLWQLRDPGNPLPAAEHLLTGATGSVLAVSTQDGVILERVTYGTRSVPVFRDPDGAVKTDPATGGPLASSEFGVRELLHGLPYLPELGERASTSADDWAGGFLEGATIFDPNQGKVLSKPASLGSRDQTGFGWWGHCNGYWILPEVDDEVLCSFSHGDVRFPYALGGVLRANNHNTTRSNRYEMTRGPAGGGGGGGGAGGVLRANNHNTTRSNRYEMTRGPAGGGGGEDGLRMNKAQIVDTLASRSGVSKADAKRAISGFGSFTVRKRHARKGRNPQTGKEIKIPAKNVVKFKAGADLSAKVRMGAPDGPVVMDAFFDVRLGLRSTGDSSPGQWLPLLPHPKIPLP